MRQCARFSEKVPLVHNGKELKWDFFAETSSMYNHTGYLKREKGIAFKIIIKNTHTKYSCKIMAILCVFLPNIRKLYYSDEGSDQGLLKSRGQNR